MKIKELDTVVLVRDLAIYRLKRGDVGVVVHCYGNGKTFEVGFVKGGGETIAVVTLSETDIRPMHNEEILQARELAPT